MIEFSPEGFEEIDLWLDKEAIISYYATIAWGLKRFIEHYTGDALMKYRIRLLITALFVAGGLIFSGCSSSPSEEELAALKALQVQADGLDAKVKDAQREKANLEKQVADKNGKLQQCQSDQDAVKKALGGK